MSNVDHPKHYTQHPSGVECIAITQHMNFCLGSAVKYLWRAGLKGDAVEDLRKAREFIDFEIARMQATGDVPADADGPHHPMCQHHELRTSPKAAKNEPARWLSAIPRAEARACKMDCTEAGRRTTESEPALITHNPPAVLTCDALDGRIGR